MYSYTYEGLGKYQSTICTEKLLKFSTKKNFNCFEWESVVNEKQGFGLATKIRMIEINEKEIKPTSEWSLG